MSITIIIPTTFEDLKAEIAGVSSENNLTAQELTQAIWADVQDQVADMIWELENDQVVEASGMGWPAFYQEIPECNCEDQYEEELASVVERIREELTCGDIEVTENGRIFCEVC